MVRADPAVVGLVISQAARRAAYNARRRECRERRRADAETLREAGAAVLLARVAAYHGVEVGDLRGRSKTRKLIGIRQVAMALAVDVLGFKLGQAAAVVAREHHTTAMAALRTVRCRCSSDVEFAADYEALRCELQVKMRENSNI